MRSFSKSRPLILIGLIINLVFGGVLANDNFTSVATTTPTSVLGATLTDGVRKTILNNGLTVLTKEVHTAPVVSVQVWYKVGSRNEKVGENGISHQLEHLMFKGTTARPVQFGRLPVVQLLLPIKYFRKW